MGEGQTPAGALADWGKNNVWGTNQAPTLSPVDTSGAGGGFSNDFLSSILNQDYSGSYGSPGYGVLQSSEAPLSFGDVY